nr:hypothetical protein [Burkholderia ubonensis]
MRQRQEVQALSRQAVVIERGAR